MSVESQLQDFFTGTTAVTDLVAAAKIITGEVQSLAPPLLSLVVVTQKGPNGHTDFTCDVLVSGETLTAVRNIADAVSAAVRATDGKSASAFAFLRRADPEDYTEHPDGVHTIQFKIEGRNKL